MNVLFAVVAGVSVANVYFAQPLIDVIGADLALSDRALGLVMAFTQVGYALGLLLLVPLVDLLDRRRVSLAMMLLSAAALVCVALAPGAVPALAAITAVGALAPLAQLLVAYAASLAPAAERARAIGTVTAGIVLGILLARTVAGALGELLGWRAVYLASAVVTLALAAWLAATLAPDCRPRAALTYPRLILSVLRLFGEERRLRVRGTLAALSFAAIVTLWTPLALPLTAPPWELSNAQVGLFGLVSAAGVIGARCAGGTAAGARGRFAVALVLMVLAWVPIRLLPYSLWPLLLGLLAIDFALQFVHVSNQSALYRTRPDAQSRLAAAYMLCYAAGCAVGASVSTVAYDRAGWPGVCTVGLSFSALALALWWVFERGEPTLAGSRAACGS